MLNNRNTDDIGKMEGIGKKDGIREGLNTGDIILCYGCKASLFFRIFDGLISFFTRSPYIHTGMVIRDPKFSGKTLKGVYVWQSGWEGLPDPQDGEIKLGVQLTALDDFMTDPTISKKYVRRVKKDFRNSFSEEKLNAIHHDVYNIPYDTDPIDWLEAIFRKDLNPQKTDRFWCSAFVSYILVRVGLFPDSLDWSIVRPSDLSSHCDFLSEIMYEKDELMEFGL